MKKYVYLLIFLFGFSNIVQAGAKLGVSLAGGVFETSAKEKENDETSTSKDAEGLFAIPSIFAEVSPNDIIFLGVDFVPVALESETTDHKQADKTASATASTVTQKAQVDFEDMLTVYARIAVNDAVYLKAGVMSVEAITNEVLGTGSKYPNKTLDGSMVGIGYENNLDSGAFIRAEVNYMEFDGETFTADNTDNKVIVDDITGYGARISVGRTF